MNEQVVLVDAEDNEIGVAEKLTVHRTGRLHRAFSVFLFNSEGDILLQQRASTKYHSGGKWTNACCGHPRPGEAVLDAASRRLFEEMGIRCEMRPLFTFTYEAQVGEGLIEHEFDHVVHGCFDGSPDANPEEVGCWRFVPVEEVLREIESDIGAFTPWFVMALPAVLGGRREAVGGYSRDAST